MGCHEDMVESPPMTGVSEALQNPPEELKKTLGVEDTPFDFKKMVAPILDEHCADCHGSNHRSGFDMRNTNGSGPSRTWTTSYNSLTKGLDSKNSNNAINICYIFQQSEQEPFGSFGAIQSGMMKNIEEGHNDVSLTDEEKKIIACWIDLAAPHGGSYSDYLSNASGYQRLEQKRERWAEIEEKNIAEYIEYVKTKADPDGHDRVKAASAITENFGIGYLPTLRALVLKKAYQGNFILVDLRGRVISRMKLSHQHTDDNIKVSLPASLSAGLYLAKFEGVDGKIQKAKISITQ
jgi:hypothetical protein